MNHRTTKYHENQIINIKPNKKKNIIRSRTHRKQVRRWQKKNTLLSQKETGSKEKHTEKEEKLRCVVVM